jgi:hypothetical protein
MLQRSARRLVSPARLGSAAGVGRALCRTTLRSVPPAALRVIHALSLLRTGQAQGRSMQAPVTADGSAVRSAASPRREVPPCG